MSNVTMRSFRRRPAPAAALLALLAPLLAVCGVLPYRAGAGEAAGFTHAQAAAGAHEYAQFCASCHGARLKGKSAPPLSGKTSGIAQQSIAAVYVYIAQQMPLKKPASLSPAQYLAIMSYILKENGVKAGPKKLTVAAARADKDLLNP